MGNCCSGEPSQNGKDSEVNMQRDIKQGGGYSAGGAHRGPYQKIGASQKGAANRGQSGSQLTNEDILRMIVKIQALFRGVLVRKQVQAIYGFSTRERMGS